MGTKKLVELSLQHCEGVLSKVQHSVGLVRSRERERNQRGCSRGKSILMVMSDRDRERHVGSGVEKDSRSIAKKRMSRQDDGTRSEKTWLGQSDSGVRFYSSIQNAESLGWYSFCKSYE